jgi:hypothetical protein
MKFVYVWLCRNIFRGLWTKIHIRMASYKLHILEYMSWTWHSRIYSGIVGCVFPFLNPLVSLWPTQNMSLGRWLLVACFWSVKNHNVSGPHLIPSFTTCQKNFFATPKTVLQGAKKSLYNRSQFRTLFLPHRFIKIRPSHQRPVSIEFSQFVGFQDSPNLSKIGKRNVRIWRKRASVRR